MGFAVFDTALGHGGIAWHAEAVLRCLLPENDADRVRSRLRAGFAEAVECAPPEHARRAISGITALLRGDRPLLDDVVLDMSGVPPFHRRVYELVRAVGPGRTLTYGQIAARLGEPNAARAVGRALGGNPFPPVVPCHRVLAANSAVGGFSAPGGTATKRRMLAAEGVHLDQPTLFDLRSAP